MAQIVEACKALSFRLARRRAFDGGPLIATLSDAWDRAMDGLNAAAG
jgi:hypothetical protein